MKIETNTERLDRIENSGLSIEDEDFNWLIRQAKRVQEIENKASALYWDFQKAEDQKRGIRRDRFLLLECLKDIKNILENLEPNDRKSSDYLRALGLVNATLARVPLD